MAATPLTNSVSPTGRISTGPVSRVHRARLDVHRRDDVVAAVGIGQQVVNQIAPSGPDPQMVVWIDDRQLRLQNRLLATIEPILPDRASRRPAVRMR